MAEAIDGEKLGKYMECSICLNTYNNPQQLTCRHQFCKQCLDPIVKFNRDGSAVINCPNRCREQTVIGRKQTTNDLGTSYEFKGVLEFMKVKDKTLEVLAPLCNYSKDCQKDVAVYCCGLMMCKACEGNHKVTEADHQGTTDVFFDKREKKLMVLCKEHVSNCTHFCSDNKFLCMYCINRTHKLHLKDTIKNEAARVRNEALANATRLVNKVDELLKNTKENISLGKEKLDMSLRERKVACLSSYLDLLNTEEERIREQFQHLSCHHMEQYPNIDATKYHHDILLKDDIELIIQKRATTESLMVSDLSNSPVPYCTVSLCDDFDFRSEHPLGDLRVTVGNISFDDLNLLGSSFAEDFSKVKDYEYILSKLSRDIETLLQESGFTEGINFVNTLDGVTREGTDVMRTSEHVQGDVENTNLTQHEDVSISQSETQALEEVSINDIVKYLQCKKNALLRNLIQTQPWILELRTKRAGDYPVHLAVKHENLEILKELLKLDNARYDVKNKDGSTLLTLAVACYRPECFRWLVEVYPQLIDIKDGSGKTPLHHAARCGSLDKVKHLLDHGADMLIKDDSGNDALHYATVRGSVNCIEELERVLYEQRQHDNGYINLLNHDNI